MHLSTFIVIIDDVGEEFEGGMTGTVGRTSRREGA
jgi:hypothetical protein